MQKHNIEQHINEMQKIIQEQNNKIDELGRLVRNLEMSIYCSRQWTTVSYPYPSNPLRPEVYYQDGNLVWTFV